MKEVYYYEKLSEGKVRCGICPHRCLVTEGKYGLCRVRKNSGGTLFALNYARCAASALDPIEKKPLYHFYPGSTIFSLGALGCSFRCDFCQNWEIAQADAPTVKLAPEQAVQLALEAGRDCIGLAYTYSEPLMWYEYVLDTARLAREQGLKNVVVTNGYINPEPLAALLPYIDALNIDVKAFQPQFYRRLCGGDLEPVLETVKACVEAGCHVELTTLLVTGLNDSPEEITQLVDWVARLDPEIPLHFCRYFPRYKLDLPPTPPESLERAWEIAREKLSYVYLGNITGGKGSSTCCPQCGAVLVDRDGFRVQVRELAGDRCAKCGTRVRIINGRG